MTDRDPAPRRECYVWTVLVLLLVLLTGCGDAPVDTAACGGEPCLTLLSPADGDTLCGDPLTVVADVANFTLTNETVEDPPPDLGHMHLYLNGQEVVQSETETVVIADYPSGGEAGVDEGEWQLSLDLSHADHTALVPYVGTLIYITIDHSLCPD